MSRTTIFRITAILAALGALACSDSTKSGALTAPGGDPLNTVSSGVTNLTLVRANAGAIRVVSTRNDFKSMLWTQDNTDIVVNNNTMAAGGTSGWHTHPGITLVAIKSGALTLYNGDDPDCRPTVYSAGQVFVEQGGHVHIARNEGAVAADWYTTYVVPAGAPTRIDAPAAGNCPF